MIGLVNMLNMFSYSCMFPMSPFALRLLCCKVRNALAPSHEVGRVSANSCR